MAHKVDVNGILSALKQTITFAQSKLKYNYSVHDHVDNKTIELIPDFCSISLLSDRTKEVVITNGGFFSSNDDLTSSLKVVLWLKKNVFARVSFSLAEVSMYSSVSLFRSLKEILLLNYPLLVNSYIGRERKSNHNVMISPKKSATYVQETPDDICISEDLINSLTSLSEDIFNHNGVIKNSVVFTHNLKSSYFVDDASTIVEFKSTFQITITLEYVNHDNYQLEDYIVEHFKCMPTSDDIDRVKLKCIKSIDAHSEFHELSSGTYPVLLKSSATDVFFHEALAAHLLSATYVIGELGVNSTIFKDGIGRFIPSLKGVDVIMDPSLENGFGSYNYDHEGVLAQKVTLIKDGHILNFLTDRRSAAVLEQIEKDKKLIDELSVLVNNDPTLLKLYVDENHLLRKFKSIKGQLKYLLEKYVLDKLIKNLNVDQSLNWRFDDSLLVNESNGHCRVEAWAVRNEYGSIVNVPCEARMSNLMIHVDTDISNSKLQLEMKKVCMERCLDFYLEVEATDGHVEVETGLFVIAPSELVRVYLDGRREYINPGTFSLNLEDFLSHIYMIGSECNNNYGFCGSNSGYVPVGSSTPNMTLLDIPYQKAQDVDIASDEVISLLSYK